MAKSGRRIGLGVAGLGRIGLLHAEHGAGRLFSAELVRVVDADEARAREAGNRLGTSWSTSFEDLLGDAKIDGVVIATPTPRHVEMVERAAAAGKHVFCEKPIALELDPTIRAIETTRAAGVKLQVGLHRRFDPDWAAAAERIHAGELGDVRFFRSSLRDMRPPPLEYVASSGGFFVDVTIHDLDTARWLVGEVEEVTAVAAALSDPGFAELGDADHAVVVLRFANGALGVIDNSRAAGYGYECSAEVMGSAATVRVDRHRRANTQWLAAGRESFDRVSDFVELFREAYRRELEAFAAAVREDRQPAVTGEDALAAFVLAQACDRSLREGRTVRVSAPRGTSS
jgi:myo-inositol 2-dehydrogenase / D-chiro-inositol 1-dehydrogenase